MNHDHIKKLLIQLKELAQKNGDGVYGDLQDAVKDIDYLLESSDISKDIQKLNLLLAPTANLQELSIDRGWGSKFCELAEKIEKIKI